jgi:hypothetical protein
MAVHKHSYTSLKLTQQGGLSRRKTRQIAANRKKSTGPRSKAGGEASRRNARRHGLAVAIGTDPAFHDDIEKLAKVLSRSSGMQKASESAREAAEAQLELLRIRKVRAWLFETLYFTTTAAPDRLVELNEKLAKLERYERSAFSRRKRALRVI